MKRIISLLLSLVLCLVPCVTAMAADPNVNHGGGGLGGAVGNNIWYGDSGVRVTVVNAETRTPASVSVDLIKPPEYTLAWNKTNIVHFGKVSKVQYNAGAGLSPNVGG